MREDLVLNQQVIFIDTGNTFQFKFKKISKD